VGIVLLQSDFARESEGAFARRDRPTCLAEHGQSEAPAVEVLKQAGDAVDILSVPLTARMPPDSSEGKCSGS
jgi:hypothetical protein